MPKKKKSAPYASTKPTKDEAVFQAVVIADSFDQKLEPITFDMPRSLLPLVNIPMIDYTLEFLASSGVQEVFIFCCYKAEMIEKYISESTWVHRPNLTVHTVVGTSSMSVGDALREIYSLSIITSDFVLVSGDVVSNLKLGPALELHKERRRKDPRVIMTVMFKKAAPNHRTRSLEDDTVVVVDPQTGQLLHFDNEPSRKGVSLDVDVFEEHSAVQFRYDLLDCRIDICAPQLLEVCTDNFDYNDLRQDVIKGIVNDEVYQYPIHTHVISGEYAARVNILRTYDSVSKDVVNRWTYPMTPDCNFLGTTSYSQMKGHIYHEKDVVLDRSSRLGPYTVVGSGTKVGADSFISHSVIGRDVIIGNNVRITGAYIWDNVKVHDGATITSAIVCNGAVIGPHTVVSQGCVVGYRVLVGGGNAEEPFVLPSNCKLTTWRCHPSDPEEEVVEDIGLGKGGNGYRWVERDPSNHLVMEVVGVEGEDDYYIDDLEESSDDSVELDERERWRREISETVERAETEGHPLENLRVELNSLKLTFPDRSFTDLARSVASALLRIAQERVARGSTPGVKLNAVLKELLSKWSTLLLDWLSSTESQVALMEKLERFGNKNPDVAEVFQDVMFILFEAEVLEEEAFGRWEEAGSVYVQKCQGFLEWLRQSSSEGASGSEDSDAESDEESEASSD